MRKAVGPLTIIKDINAGSVAGWFIICASNMDSVSSGHIIAPTIVNIVSQIDITQEDVMLVAGNMDDVWIKSINE